MTLHVKHTDGTWHVIAPGDLWLKRGSSWDLAGRVGVVTEAQTLREVYVGPPDIPLNLRVVTPWGYNNLVVTWDKSTGTIPAVSYRTQLTYASLSNVVGTQEGTDLRASWGVNQMTRYQVRVQARGANGALSPWSPPLRLSIGQPEIIRDVMVPKQRDWSATREVNMYRGEEWGNKIPANVKIDIMEVHLKATWDVEHICFGDSEREIHFIRRGLDAGGAGTRPNPWNARLSFGQNDDGLHGLKCVGTVWSVRGVSNDHRATGTITSEGTETYMVPGTEVVQEEVKNGYW